MYAPPDNQRRASSARQHGREAIAEAVQHHIDRLGPNKTKAVYAAHYPLERMEAAPKGAIARAHAINEANWAENGVPTFFTPAQQKWADRQRQRNDPLGALGAKAEGFLQLRSLGKELATSFDPRTKAGLANMASMFVGGPKGDATPMMENLGMKGQFENYGMESAKGMRFNPSVGRALDRGLTHEGPTSISGSTKGAGIRGLIRRAQGVGGYKQANPLDVIEGLRSFESKRLQESDAEKGFLNSLGRTSKIGNMQRSMRRAFEAKHGGDLTGYSDPGEPGLFREGQPHDYADRMTLLNLAKAHPDNPMLPQGAELDPIRQALYDMLFGGKGLAKRPQRPGPRPGESPYGGGPFG